MGVVAQVENILRERFQTVIETRNDLPNQVLEFNEPLTRQEAIYFLKGLEESIFSIDDQGYIQSPLLPIPPERTAPQQRMIEVFWYQAGGIRRLYRESINQIATACRLIFEYGWEIDEIKMEPSEAEFGHLAYGVDIFTVGEGSTIPLCCENKSNNKEFEKLVEQFKSCCSLGKHPRKGCKDRTNHPKYEFCLNARPKYCWFISPQIEVFYELSYFDNEVIVSSELPEPLDKKSILLGCEYD